MQAQPVARQSVSGTWAQLKHTVFQFPLPTTNLDQLELRPQRLPQQFLRINCKILDLVQEHWSPPLWVTSQARS